QDTAFELAILPGFQIVHRPQVELGSRQERANPDVYHQTAFDAVDYFARKRQPFLVRFLDLFPNPAPVRTRAIAVHSHPSALGAAPRRSSHPIESESRPCQEILAPAQVL